MRPELGYLYSLMFIINLSLFTLLDCVEPLGVERFHILNSAMKSPPHYSHDNAHYGRLNYIVYGNNGWLKETSIREAYLQINLGLVPSLVAAVATAGIQKYVVTKYKLAFSRDQYDWFEYREDGQVKVSCFELYNWCGLRGDGRSRKAVLTCITSLYSESAWRWRKAGLTRLYNWFDYQED